MANPRGPKTGIAAALALTGIGDEPGGGEEQLSLAELLGLPGLPAGAAPSVERARGPGRPPGAHNRSTLEWAEYLAARYISPLERLAQFTAMSVEEMAARLRCTPLEAAKFIADCAVAQAPYRHSKAPTLVGVGDAAGMVDWGGAPEPPPPAKRPGDDAIDVTGVRVIDHEDHRPGGKPASGRAA